MVNEDVFRKIKARVGKRAKAQANETDVSFRKVGLHVTEQRRVAADANQQQSTTTARGLTILQLAQQLKHPASAMRVSALKGFQNLLVDQKAAEDHCEEMVHSYIGPASLVDISATVREEGFGLLQKLPFASFSTALVLSALNSLDPRQAIHAGNVLDWLLQTGHTLTGGEGLLTLESNLISSLTRLLSTSANSNSSSKSAGILSSMKESTEYEPRKKKSKKRKMEAPNGDRIIVLKAIRSVLVDSFDESHQSSDKHKVRVVRDIAMWEADYTNDGPPLCEKIQEDLEQLLTKLRDVLLEETTGDFAVAADCFRHALHCLASNQPNTVDRLCQQVVKAAYNNGSTLLLLALARCDSDSSKIMKVVIREACLPTTDDETFLTVAASVVENGGDLTEEFWNTMSSRFFSPTNSVEDMCSKGHRHAVRLVCTRHNLPHMEHCMIRLPSFLAAWAAAFPDDSVVCVDFMKEEAIKNTQRPSVEQWRSGLEPLFELTLFGSLPDSLQHRFICLVTNLGSPTAKMLDHWSTWIARNDVGERHMSLMLQCMHGMRHQLSVRAYLGFLIDSTGVFLETEIDSKSFCERSDEKIEEICWAMHQIGVSKILPKLRGVIQNLLQKGKARSLATFLKCFARDLDNDESIINLLPEGVFKQITEEFRDALKSPDKEMDTKHPLWEFFRRDAIALTCFVEDLQSSDKLEADQDRARLLDILYSEVILPLHGGMPTKVLSAFQNLSKPSSVMWLKIARLRKVESENQPIQGK